MRLGWLIGGAQGTGIDTSAGIFGAAIARAGYYIFGSREYYSNIKGRHSYFSLIVSDKPQHSIDSKVDILATFDAETAFQHFDEAKSWFVYDKAQESASLDKIRSIEPGIAKEQAAILENAGFGLTVADITKYLGSRGVKSIPIDYGKIMNDVVSKVGIDPFVAERARNMIAVGASFALLGINQQHIIDEINSVFGKNEKFVKLNVIAVQEGMQASTGAYFLKELPRSGHRVQLDGNTISAIGKIYGGLRFQSYYPITPASDESTYIEANQMLGITGSEEKNGVVVLQTEDELAAINAANGAALTGARAATATSGPGFSLMNEGISWAGMNEVPVVISYYMRGAPATGLPTRSGQSDLKLALNAGHGEFPRIVIASGSHEEIFSDAVMALNLAEICQTPVIHIIEKTLANAYSAMDEGALKTESVRISRGKLVFPENPEDYKRFEFSDDGISPRAFLGHAKMFYTGDEHNEYGHITEGSSNRIAMYEKRMKKLKIAEESVSEEYKVTIAGNSDTVLLTWGSPKGAIIDAIDELSSGGIDIEMVQVRLLSPYPKEIVAKALAGKKRIIAVENNYGAQGAEVMTENIGVMPTHYILKWNGRPIARDEIVQAVQEIVNKNTKRIVLNGGK
ncbi:MAG: 2-oxoacid:ferredoxin oxidoreductase subunit alpha [Candidatus Micrarchaeia archaeon]